MTQKIIFKRGNLVADDHPVPVIAEVSLSLSCSVPTSIALIADEQGIHYFLTSNTYAITILLHICSINFSYGSSTYAILQ